MNNKPSIVREAQVGLQWALEFLCQQHEVPVSEWDLVDLVVGFVCRGRVFCCCLR